MDSISRARVYPHNLCDKLERQLDILLEAKKPLKERVQSLISGWAELANHCQSYPGEQIFSMALCFRDQTLSIILCGQWDHIRTQYQVQLEASIQLCKKELVNITHKFEQHITQLLQVLQNPWGNPILKSILERSDTAVTQQEYDYFMRESPFMILTRLQQLYNDKCEDLALNLVTALMKCCDYSQDQPAGHQFSMTLDQTRFTFDVYIALLMKANRADEVRRELQELNIEHGYDLVMRFTHKRTDVSRLWRSAYEVTVIAASTFCMKAVLMPFSDVGTPLAEIAKVWLQQCNDNDDLPRLKICWLRMAPAFLTAEHMYVFCDAITPEFAEKMRYYKLQLLIRAISTDMNMLERLKVQKTWNKDLLNPRDSDEDKASNMVQEPDSELVCLPQATIDILIHVTTNRIATAFVRMADWVQHSPTLLRETLLTAFSVYPTKEVLSRIEESAYTLGNIVVPCRIWTCYSHPPQGESDSSNIDDDLLFVCSLCEQAYTPINIENALKCSVNPSLDVYELVGMENPGIDSDVSNDVVVLIFAARNQPLNWNQRWPDLHRLCNVFLHKGACFQNITTDLDYAKYNYDMKKLFDKNKKIIEQERIERMAELERQNDSFSMLPDNSSSDEDWQEEPKRKRRKYARRRKLRDSSSGEDVMSVSPSRSFVPQQLKSIQNENSTKLLRTFRHNKQKRSATSQFEGSHQRNTESIFPFRDTFNTILSNAIDPADENSLSKNGSRRSLNRFVRRTTTVCSYDNYVGMVTRSKSLLLCSNVPYNLDDVQKMNSTVQSQLSESSESTNPMQTTAGVREAVVDVDESVEDVLSDAVVTAASSSANLSDCSNTYISYNTDNSDMGMGTNIFTSESEANGNEVAQVFEGVTDIVSTDVLSKQLQNINSSHNYDDNISNNMVNSKITLDTTYRTSEGKFSRTETVANLESTADIVSEDMDIFNCPIIDLVSESGSNNGEEMPEGNAEEDLDAVVVENPKSIDMSNMNKSKSRIYAIGLTSTCDANSTSEKGIQDIIDLTSECSSNNSMEVIDEVESDTDEERNAVLVLEEPEGADVSNMSMDNSETTSSTTDSTSPYDAEDEAEADEELSAVLELEEPNVAYMSNMSMNNAKTTSSATDSPSPCNADSNTEKIAEKGSEAGEELCSLLKLEEPGNVDVSNMSIDNAKTTSSTTDSTSSCDTDSSIEKITEVESETDEELSAVLELEEPQCADASNMSMHNSKTVSSTTDSTSSCGADSSIAKIIEVESETDEELSAVLELEEPQCANASNMSMHNSKTASSTTDSTSSCGTDSSIAKIIDVESETDEELSAVLELEEPQCADASNMSTDNAKTANGKNLNNTVNVSSDTGNSISSIEDTDVLLQCGTSIRMETVTKRANKISTNDVCSRNRYEDVTSPRLNSPSTNRNHTPEINDTSSCNSAGSLSNHTGVSLNDVKISDNSNDAQVLSQDQTRTHSTNNSTPTLSFTTVNTTLCSGSRSYEADEGDSYDQPSSKRRRLNYPTTQSQNSHSTAQYENNEDRDDELTTSDIQNSVARPQVSRRFSSMNNDILAALLNEPDEEPVTYSGPNQYCPLIHAIQEKLTLTERLAALDRIFVHRCNSPNCLHVSADIKQVLIAPLKIPVSNGPIETNTGTISGEHGYIGEQTDAENRDCDFIEDENVYNTHTPQISERVRSAGENVQNRLEPPRMVHPRPSLSPGSHINTAAVLNNYGGTRHCQSAEAARDALTRSLRMNDPDYSVGTYMCTSSGEYIYVGEVTETTSTAETFRTTENTATYGNFATTNNTYATENIFPTREERYNEDNNCIDDFGNIREETIQDNNFEDIDPEQRQHEDSDGLTSVHVNANEDEDVPENNSGSVEVLSTCNDEIDILEVDRSYRSAVPTKSVTDKVQRILFNVPGMISPYHERSSTHFSSFYQVYVVQLVGAHRTGASAAPAAAAGGSNSPQTPQSTQQQSQQTSTQVTPHIQRVGQPRATMPTATSGHNSPVSPPAPSHSAAAARPSAKSESLLRIGDAARCSSGGSGGGRGLSVLGGSGGISPGSISEVATISGDCFAEQIAKHSSTITTPTTATGAPTATATGPATNTTANTTAGSRSKPPMEHEYIVANTFNELIPKSSASVPMVAAQPTINNQITRIVATIAATPTTSSSSTAKRATPLINIISSQQIVKSGGTIISPPVFLKTSNSNSTTTLNHQQQPSITPPQLITSNNSFNNRTSSINPLIANVTTGNTYPHQVNIKTVLAGETGSTGGSRVMQIICKSADGRLIPVTSLANRVLKVTSASSAGSSTEGATAETAISTNTSTLPKFNQVFGKSIYSTSTTANSAVVQAQPITIKGSVQSLQSLQSLQGLQGIQGLQTLQGGVIYTRQMPVGVSQTINIIGGTPQSRQVFRIAAAANNSCGEQHLSLVKDTVIHSKMSALLAAALQGQKTTAMTTTANIITATNLSSTTTDAVAVDQQQGVPGAAANSKVLVKPNVNLSSTTLEQLREFDMVYKQVTERSSTSTPADLTSETTASNCPAATTVGAPTVATTVQLAAQSQRISLAYVNNQGNLNKLNCAQLPLVVVSSYGNAGPPTGSILAATNTKLVTAKVTKVSSGTGTPTNNALGTKSAALKVCTPPNTPPTITQSPSQSPHACASQVAITAAGAKTSPIQPKPAAKPQEDEHTTQRIFDILAEYAEQLRNAPDLNNKPAPRRRSNPPTNPTTNTSGSGSSKRKKTSATATANTKSGKPSASAAVSTQQSQLSSSSSNDLEMDDARTIGSEDSNAGVAITATATSPAITETTNICAASSVPLPAAHITVSTTPQQITRTTSPPQAPTATTSAATTVGAAVTSRHQQHQLIITDPITNQTRNLIIADGTNAATAVLVPGNYLMPLTSMVKSGQQIAVVNAVGGNKILATVPAGRNLQHPANMLLFQSLLNQLPVQSQQRKTVVTTCNNAAANNASVGTTTVKYSLQPTPILTTTDTPDLLLRIANRNPAQMRTQPVKEDAVEQQVAVLNAGACTTSTTSALTPILPIATSVIQGQKEASSQFAMLNNKLLTGKVNAQIGTLQQHQSSISTATTPSIVHGVLNSIGRVTSVVVNHTNNNHNQALATVITPHSAVSVASAPVTLATLTSPSVVVASTFSTAAVSVSVIEQPSSSQTKDVLRNGGSVAKRTQVQIQHPIVTTGPSSNSTTKQPTSTYYPSSSSNLLKFRKLMTNATEQSSLQTLPLLQRRNAAVAAAVYERELRIQKSLSEECEDLGVDEPSASDLFPEAADLLVFDNNHSPTATTFDNLQIHHSTISSTPDPHNVKHGIIKQDKLTLFGDNDFLFDSDEYQTSNQSQMQPHQHSFDEGATANVAIVNGNDHTLLQTCASMSDVTMNSPISPEYPVDRYAVHKYSNRKKQQLSPAAVVSHSNTSTSTSGSSNSGEDTTSTEDPLESMDDNSRFVVVVKRPSGHAVKRCCGRRKMRNRSCSSCNGVSIHEEDMEEITTVVEEEVITTSITPASTPTTVHTASPQQQNNSRKRSLPALHAKRNTPLKKR